MPFNVSGVFSRLYSWVTDRDNDLPIDAARMDAEMNGMVDAFNAIVSQTQPFTGPLRGAAGTIANPAYSFGNDPNTGMYRAGADSIGFSVGGSWIADFDSGVFRTKRIYSRGDGTTGGFVLQDASGSTIISAFRPFAASGVASGVTWGSNTMGFRDDGNVEFSGRVVATRFDGSAAGLTGSAAGLTNIPGGEMTGVIPEANISTALVRITREVNGGNGLVGGGSMGIDRTISLGTPSSITATSTNSVTATSHTHSISEGAIRTLIAEGGFGLGGTYAFLRNNSGSGVGRGGDLSGSNLSPADDAGGFESGITVSGTWKCMGTCGSGRSTLWLRITF